MTERRWLIAGAIGVFVVAVAVISALPHHWHGQAVTLATVGHPSTTDFVTYRCPAAWGSGAVTGPTNLPAPVSGTPCGDRTALQVTGVADVVIGIGALAFVVLWRRSDPTDDLAIV